MKTFLRPASCSTACGADAILAASYDGCDLPDGELEALVDDILASLAGAARAASLAESSRNADSDIRLAAAA